MLSVLSLLACGVAPSIPVPTIVEHTESFPLLRNDRLRAKDRVPYVSIEEIATTELLLDSDDEALGEGRGAEFIKWIASEEVLVVCNDFEYEDANEDELSNPNPSVDLYTMSAVTGEFTLVSTYDLTGIGKPQSVAFANDVIVVAIDTGGRAGSDAHGLIGVMNATGIKDNPSPTMVFTSVGGFLPDHVSFTPDGTKLVVALEAEPKESPFMDEGGGIAVFTALAWNHVDSYSLTVITFSNLDGSLPDLLAAGGHFPFASNGRSSVSQDTEPEYITYSPDSRMAYVALQENNMLAVVDLETNQVTTMLGLGYKSYETWPIDVSDKDKAVNIRSWPHVWGMYQPDTIKLVTIGGTEYIFTANEGDAKDYGDATEEFRVKDIEDEDELDSALNTSSFPADARLTDDRALGRMRFSSERGKVHGAYADIYGYGARSFSIWNTNGDLIWDSGNLVEMITAELDYAKQYFNANDGRKSKFDERSDDKGAEPESLEVFVRNGRTYLVGGLERASMFMIWDVTDPAQPIFLSLNVAHDCSSSKSKVVDPEAMQYVPAADNPLGKDIMIISGAVSRTVSTFEIRDSAFSPSCAFEPEAFTEDYQGTTLISQVNAANKDATSTFADVRNSQLETNVTYKSLNVLDAKVVTVGGSSVEGRAEFLAYDASTNKLFVCNSEDSRLDVYEIGADGTMAEVAQIGLSGSPQSAAFGNGIVAVALDQGFRDPAAPDPSDVIDIFDIEAINASTTEADAFQIPAAVAGNAEGIEGYVPDHISFTPDKAKLCIAIEGEPLVIKSGSEPFADGKGGVTCYTAADWFDKETYTGFTVGFADLDALSMSALQALGVHMPGSAHRTQAILPSFDIEPEYITYSTDSRIAYVTLQENNAVAVLNLDTKKMEQIIPLGLKNWGVYEADFSQDDGEIKLRHWPFVFGMYQPDTIKTVTIGGEVYIVTANEGDAREFCDDDSCDADDNDDGLRINKGDVILDSNLFPAYSLANEFLGKIRFSQTEGVENGVYKELHTFGGRSFSLWRASDGKLVWDSGSQVAAAMAETSYTRPYFNVNDGATLLEDDDTALEDRSPKKGAEVRRARGAGVACPPAPHAARYRSQSPSRCSRTAIAPTSWAAWSVRPSSTCGTSRTLPTSSSCPSTLTATASTPMAAPTRSPASRTPRPSSSSRPRTAPRGRTSSFPPGRYPAPSTSTRSWMSLRRTRAPRASPRRRPPLRRPPRPSPPP